MYLDNMKLDTQEIFRLQFGPKGNIDRFNILNDTVTEIFSIIPYKITEIQFGYSEENKTLYIRWVVKNNLQYQLVCGEDGRLRFDKYDGTWINLWIK